MNPAILSPSRSLIHLAALALIVIAAALRIAYLANDCPLDLAPDEAHYWDWSRHLDWSYYSKGPGIAFLIRVGCELFGDWSVNLTGHEMLAVRMPAVILGSLTLFGLYVLTYQVYRKESIALGMLLGALTFPPLAVGSMLSTIDGPYVCCWTWALVVTHALLFGKENDSPSPRMAIRGFGWILLGLLIGLGILAKYTMVLIIPSLLLFLLFSPFQRQQLRHSGFWIMCVVAGLCCTPILIWNAQHDWVTFLHVGRQAGVQGESTFGWIGPLEFLAGQFGLLMGFWFVPWLAAMIQTAREQSTIENQQSKMLCWLSAPMFLVFLAFSFKTKTEINWPITAYLSGIVLAVGWIFEQCHSLVAWWRRLARGSVAVALVLGLCLTIFMHHTEWLYSVFGTQYSVRRWDPTCRLRGWRTLAAEIDRQRAELRQRGIEPVIAASGWSLPGEIGFYCSGHPHVYSFALAGGGRHSQYDLWRPNPTNDPDAFRGRTVIYIGEITPTIRAAFHHVELTRWITHRVSGHVVATWPITVCVGFTGFTGFQFGGGY